MPEHLSPVMEGFGNPTMATVFQEILKITPIGSTDKISFLKKIISEQKDTADSLMDTAKKIGHVSKKISTKKDAYDAAFETDMIAPMPNRSDTLQGYTIVFFVLSFFSLAIVSSIITNQTTGSYKSALYVFGLFVVAFIIALGIITRIA